MINPMINHNTDSKKRLWVLGGYDASYSSHQNEYVCVVGRQGQINTVPTILCKMSEKTVFFYFFRKPEENHKT